MPSAIEQVVNIYVSLGNRQRLEAMRLERQQQTSQGAVPPPTSVASDESTRKLVDHPTTPIVLITERH
jgi:hypothetical protein